MQKDDNGDGENSQSNQLFTNVVDTTVVSPVSAEQILREMETDQTKLLSNDQLRRYVLLKQVQVLTLQQKRLEQLNQLNIEPGKSVTIDYVGFDDECMYFSNLKLSLTKAQGLVST